MLNSPGNLLEMQILGSYSRPTKLETLEVGPNNPCFNRLSRWFWYMLNLRTILVEVHIVPRFMRNYVGCLNTQSWLSAKLWVNGFCSYIFLPPLFLLSALIKHLSRYISLNAFLVDEYFPSTQLMSVQITK